MTRLAQIFYLLVDNNYVHSQQDLADAVDISRPVISQLISGKRNPTDKHIFRICRTYPFISGDWLRTGEGTMLRDDIPHMPSDAEIVEARDYADEQARRYKEELELIDENARRASLYDAKVLEVQNLYSRLSEKEAEISRLLSIINDQNEKNRELRMQLASSLLIPNDGNESQGMSVVAPDET